MATAHPPVMFPLVVREHDADIVIKAFVNDPEVRATIALKREVREILGRERGWNGRKRTRRRRRRW